jgi:hypothetical protein
MFRIIGGIAGGEQFVIRLDSFQVAVPPLAVLDIVIMEIPICSVVQSLKLMTRLVIIAS